MADDDDWVAQGETRATRRGEGTPGAGATGMSKWTIAPYSVAGAPTRGTPTRDPASDASTTSARPVTDPRRPPVDTGSATSSRRAAQPVDDGITEMRPATQLGTRPNTVLAGFGGVVLMIVATAIGASADVIITDKVGIWSGIALTIGAFVAALMTRKSDLLSVVVAPPIIYTVFAGISLWLTATNGISLTSLADVAVSGFAPMALATGIAALIAGIKLVTTRPHERP